MSYLNSATPSGAKTADGVICARACILTSLTVIGDGTNAASAILYDNATGATAPAVAHASVDAGLVESNQPVPSCGIVCNNGLYLDITGTGAIAYVSFVIA